MGRIFAVSAFGSPLDARSVTHPPDRSRADRSGERQSVSGHAFRPRLQHAARFEAEVVVQGGRVMLVDDEPGLLAGASLATASRLRRPPEVALATIRLELLRHACSYRPVGSFRASPPAPPPLGG